MDDKFSGESRKFNTAESSSGVGKKKSLDWDLNDWKWDGHHFVATPLNPATLDCRNKQLIAVPASNSSSSYSEEATIDICQKRGNILAIEGNGLCREDGSLILKLGGHNHQLSEEELGNNGKRSKLLGGNSSRCVCQVEGCGSDLSNARDYHRRHKVCEMHAKASEAIVGGVMQRFCQQCSRFQLLEEFDEGKRSCRRQLAGHNRRRRKTHSDTTVSGSSLTDDTASRCLLINLLNALTNLLTDNSDKSNDQDFLSHLLGNIASLAGSSDSRNLSGTLQASQDLHAAGTSTGLLLESAIALHSNGVAAKESSSNPLCSPSKATCNRDNQGSLKSANHPLSVPVAPLEMPSRENIIEVSPCETVQAFTSQCSPTLKLPEDVLSAKGGALCSLQPMLPSDSSGARFRINDFDLNCKYSETQDCGVACEEPTGLSSGAAIRDSHQSSPPQTSCNSESSSVHSLSSSNGDAQSRTDRIVFKLFGKDPNDFPLVLRAQILDWLSHTPTDIESYIRPGCVVFTIYLRLDDSIWEDLNHNLCSSLNRLLCTSDDDFWRTGWIYARLQNRMAFVHHGNIVLDATPLLLERPDNCQIVCVSPIAVAVSASVNFMVQGFNLAQPSTRFLCAFEGKYLSVETTHSLVGDTDPRGECDGYQCLNFSCSLPYATGRGVIEVEDHGVSSGFFPFVVAEEDVCCEIRMLENLINIASCDYILHENLDATSARHQAMDFLNEMGWLLRRSQLKARSKQVNFHPDLFSLKRFRWLMAFAMDQEWCAVVKNLLDMLFQGIVDLCGRTPSELASSENLLHVAVKKNCKLMVRFLVTYKPSASSEEKGTDCFLFRPDMLGPSDITPLHIVASISAAEGVLDALIDDPGQYGIKAWKSARDSTGFTPEDYALAKGYQSYILLVQKKINNATEKSHVVLDIDGSQSCKQTNVNIEKCTLRQMQQPSCKLCNRQQLACRTSMSRSLLYRPLTLLMVGIAAVCVCVGLLFKGPPEVIFVYHPFRWESLECGTM